MHNNTKQIQSSKHYFAGGPNCCIGARPKKRLPCWKRPILKPEHLDASLNLSGAYILTKKFKQAVRLLETLREQAPDNAMVWTNLGAAYLGICFGPR